MSFHSNIISSKPFKTDKNRELRFMNVCFYKYNTTKHNTKMVNNEKLFNNLFISFVN